jgi:hypothetical protein
MHTLVKDPAHICCMFVSAAVGCVPHRWCVSNAGMCQDCHFVADSIGLKTLADPCDAHGADQVALFEQVTVSSCGGLARSCGASLH